VNRFFGKGIGIARVARSPLGVEGRALGVASEMAIKLASAEYCSAIILEAPLQDFSMVASLPDLPL
jgi:hypothetical protein